MSAKPKYMLPPELPKLPCGWEWKALAQLVDDKRGICYGIVQPGKHDENGTQMVNSGDVISKLSGEKISFRVKNELHEKYKRSTIQGGEVLLTLVGANFGKAIIAPPSYRGLNCSRAVGIIPVLESAQFVKLCLESKLSRFYMDNWVNTTAQPTFNLSDVANLPIPWPPEYIRNEISNKAIPFEQKIETNRHINQTLEQIAQAIFKSWFVDFEPVKAKIAAREALIADYQTRSGKAPSPQEIAEVEKQAAIAAIAGAGDIIPTVQLQTLADLFPNQLVESELGEIPEGWEVKSFGDVSTCFDSKRVPLSKKKREEKKPGDIPYYGATSVMDYVNEWIFDDIYLLLGEDGSVVKDDGSPFVQYIWGKSWVNNHAHVLQGKAGVSTEQLMLFMQSQNIASYVTGAVQLKLNQKNMNSIPFFDAGEELNTFFYQVIEPFYSAIRNNSDEIEVLSHTRDILLPKLLSGEIELAANQKD